MQLPQGFSHVGDGRLCISDEHLQKLKTPRDINEVYQVADTWIAKGMYGIVRGAVSKQSGISYAAKFLRRRRRGQCCLNEINHEIAVLMLCADSDHVVKLQAVHETRSEIALILELATGGELQTLIDEQGQLTEQTTRVCMREILRALQHMHSKSIAHLDLKPQNILLAGKSVDDGLKLCDFGIARFISEKNKIHEIAGTPDYVAPEVLHYNPLSLQTDIWSIGVVAYVLLTGLSPFGGDTKQETFLNVTKCSLTFPDDLFSGISSDAIDFIKSALRIMPKDRLTVDECLEHRWLKEDTVCLREEMLAARASAAAHNQSDTRAVMNANGIDSGSSTDTVVGNGNNGYGIEPSLRLHETNTKQKVLPVVECDTIHTATTVVASIASSDSSSVSTEYDWYEEGGGGGGGRKTSSPPGEPKLLQGSITHDITTIAEENKENVIVVGGLVSSRSLFPDAPTTPKVSRKTLPVEPLNDGHHHHHHQHYHHHPHNHNHHNHYHNHQYHSHYPSYSNHQAHQNSFHVLNHQHNGSSSNGSASITAFAPIRQGSPSCVKKNVQKLHIQSPVLQRRAVAGGSSSSSDGTAEMMTVNTKSCDEPACSILTPPLAEWQHEPELVNDSTTNGCNNLSVGNIPSEVDTTNTNTFAVTPVSSSSNCRSTAVSTVSELIANGHNSKSSVEQSDKDAITC